MLTCLDPLRELTFLSMLLRFLMAACCGAVIGWERSVSRHAAGLRTHIIVCLGSASVMLLNQYLLVLFQTTADPARLGAQVISGIGFLGAGSIIVTGQHREQRVRGLTTAAGLWASAFMGLTVGAGFYEAALVLCVCLFCVIAVMNRLDLKYLKSLTEVRIYVEFAPDTPFSAAVEVVRSQKWHIANAESIENHHLSGYGMLLDLRCSEQNRDLDGLLVALRAKEGISFAQSV